MEPDRLGDVLAEPLAQPSGTVLPVAPVGGPVEQVPDVVEQRGRDVSIRRAARSASAAACSWWTAIDTASPT